MRQAIVTKYLGPTDTKGSRIVASCQAKRSIFHHWNFAEDPDANHEAAARNLATELGWIKPGGRMIGGALPDGRIAWVLP